MAAQPERALVWFDQPVGYSVQWVVAPRGTVRHAQLTEVDAQTAAVINRWAKPYASAYTVALGPDVLACGAITSHALPAVVRSVGDPDRYKVCGLCRDITTALDQASD